MGASLNPCCLRDVSTCVAPVRSHFLCLQSVRLRPCTCGVMHRLVDLSRSLSCLGFC